MIDNCFFKSLAKNFFFKYICLLIDSKQNNSNDDSVDDLPGSAVELESKNKVRIISNYL